MNDQVTREDRVDPKGGDPYGEQVTGIIDKLGGKKPELLWILLLVMVIEGAQLFRASAKIDVTKDIMTQVIAHLGQVENNRREENRRFQEVNKELASTLSRQTGTVATLFSEMARNRGRTEDE